MLSKCANPQCSSSFRYLREGKLFEIQGLMQGPRLDGKKPVRRSEFFWLCGECCTILTVINDPKRGVITVPIPQTTQFLVRRAAAS